MRKQPESNLNETATQAPIPLNLAVVCLNGSNFTAYTILVSKSSSFKAYASRSRSSPDVEP